MVTSEDPGPASPCIGVCQMAAPRGLCIGCLRTMSEITRWIGMTHEERRAVLAELPRRAEGAVDAD